MPNTPYVYYVDQHGFLRQKSDIPQEEDGKYDALFRTSLAYMVYGEQRMLDAITSCLKIDGEGNLIVYRHFNYGKENSSRDQLAAALIALKFKGHYQILRETLNAINWKISDRFSQTIDFYFWQKSLLGNKFYANIFYISVILQFLFIIPWNFTLKMVGNFTSVNQLKFIPNNYFNLPLWKRRIAKLMYPVFSLFLLSLQIRVAPKTRLKRIVKSFVLLEVERSNYFINNALSENHMRDINYVPMRGIRWNDRLDQTNNNNLRLMNESEKGTYNFDKDLMNFSFYEF